MSEKRFRIYTDQIDHWTIVGLDLLQEPTGRRLIVADIENILNDLYNENEELKKILGFLRNDNATDILNVLNSQENQIWELKKENEQLKKDCTVLIYHNQEYRKENEQLKQFIQSLAEQSVNGKVMLRDGKVYDLNEILKKGDVE